MTATNSPPPAVSSVVPCLVPDGAAKAVEFYKAAFAAEELNRIPAQDPAKLMHSHLRINGGSVIVNDAFPEHGFPFQPMQGFSMHLQVDDAQAWFDRAVAAGCTPAMPVQKVFWGDLYGQVVDPFGVRWAFGESPA